MTTYDYNTKDVCAKEIFFDLDGEGRLHNVHFKGGCPGNLKALSKLLEGADAKHAAELLRGNDCGGRGTSCADQLAIAVEQALESKTAQA